MSLDDVMAFWEWFDETRDDLSVRQVEDCCETGPDYTIQSSELYQAYREWCNDNGFKAESSVRMAEEWRRLGFDRYRMKGTSRWRGVQLAVAPLEGLQG